VEQCCLRYKQENPRAADAIRVAKISPPLPRMRAS
jgi:hypothetical protein